MQEQYEEQLQDPSLVVGSLLLLVVPVRFFFYLNHLLLDVLL